MIATPSKFAEEDPYFLDIDQYPGWQSQFGNSQPIKMEIGFGMGDDAKSDRPWMASDGRYVGFISSATNLVAGDTNCHSDVFVHDLQVGTTIRASIASTGAQGNFGSRRLTLSSDPL